MGYQRKDVYHRRARAAGYRARSAYKLAELDARFRILRPGDAVVDLGAWPGGWLQVALERVGPKGIVVGADLVAVAPLPAPNLRLVTGDVRDPATTSAIRALLDRPADVVLSDLAPKLTGVRATDEARAAEVVNAALASLPALLRAGGGLLIKVFMGPAHEEAMTTARRLFSEVRTTRARSTRQGSAELYTVGRGYLPPTEP